MATLIKHFKITLNKKVTARKKGNGYCFYKYKLEIFEKSDRNERIGRI